ncbi:hypothetical protein BDF19DRAFT_282545 [Syncephalis fuscata]|nr:hypothetical protein BDF19DRAFT_282545 [Syncephalis fuscata]
MYIGSARNQLFDFFILHVITTCHAIDQFYSILAPPSLQLRLIRSLWLYLLVVYICQGRPPIDSATILEPFSDTRLYSWPIIFNLALDHQDEHVPKLVKAMYSLEKKYGVCHGKWRATAAATVKLVTTENQWSFIGKGKTAR